MTTDYDPIAEQYKRSKLQPWRAHVESYTLLALLGNLSGKSVVDVACGEGFYTRLLRAAGAQPVRGIDLSDGMIALARAEEAARPLGIEYAVGDGRDLRVDGPVDIVAAAYLLNYAPDRAELDAMCRSIARCLPPGGRFVTVNQNQAADFRALPSFRKYGFETTPTSPWGEGTPITWTFYLDDGTFSIENYHLSVATHEDVLKNAGFSHVRWHQPRLAPDGEAKFGRAFWTDLLEHSPITFLEATK